MAVYTFTDYDGCNYSFRIVNHSSAVSMARQIEYEKIAANFRSLFNRPKNLNVRMLFLTSNGY